MFEVGRICVKLAGRDAGKQCVIVEELGNGLVMIDGQTRRRKCNVRHLEPTEQTVELKKGASHAEVKSALSKLNIEVMDTKPKAATTRPKKQRKKKVYEEKPVAKKEAAKEKKTEEKPAAAKKSEAKEEVKTTEEPKAEKKAEDKKE